MTRKMLLMSLMVLLLSLPAMAGPGGQRGKSVNYMDQRIAELKKMFEAAPDKRLGAATQYFTRKLGAKPGYKHDGASPTWLVRSHQMNGMEFCVKFQLSIAGETYQTNQKHLAKSHVDTGKTKCDHRVMSSFAPVVLQFLN